MARYSPRQDFDAPAPPLIRPQAKCLECGREYLTYPDWRQPCVAVRHDARQRPYRCNGQVIGTEEWP